MTRVLPWLAESGSSLKPAKREAIKRPNEHARSNPATSPNTSPTTRPSILPAVRSRMNDGSDDMWIMVEDELMSTARLFTQHLHHAAYERLKKKARIVHDDAKPVKRQVVNIRITDVRGRKIEADDSDTSGDEIMHEHAVPNKNLARLMQGFTSDRGSTRTVLRRPVKFKSHRAAGSQNRPNVTNSRAQSSEVDLDTPVQTHPERLPASSTEKACAMLHGSSSEKQQDSSQAKLVNRPHPKRALRLSNKTNLAKKKDVSLDEIPTFLV